MTMIRTAVFAAALLCAFASSAQSYLKQSTASQVRSVGPFLDPADGTAEGGLTIDAADVRIKKNGAADVAKNSGGCTHDINGIYECTFDATDTNTVGELHVSICETGAVCVTRTYWVLEEAVYDAYFAASAPGYVANAFPTNFSSLAITGGGAVTAGTVSDKTGYSLSQSFPTNFSSLAITGGGAVTAGTVSDKTGYALTQSFPTNFSSMSIDGSGRVTLAASVNNCIAALGCGAQGTLSGTHSSTTADLGTNAPASTTEVVGKTLIIGGKASRIISAYNSGTGVATFSPPTGLTLSNGDQWYLYDTALSPVPSADLLDSMLVSCTVDTANFAGSTTTVACDLTDRDGATITQATGDLTGLEFIVTSGADIREKRFIQSTTWDGTNSELRLTLSRALPSTQADNVTAIIR